MSISRVGTIVSLALVLTVPPVLGAGGPGKKAPESEAVRFARLLGAYYPGSTYELVEDSRHETPSGAYRLVRVDRKCESQFLSGPIAMLVDEGSGMAYPGSIGRMPKDHPTGSLEKIKAYVSDFVPGALEASLGIRSVVSWNEMPVRSGGVIPFVLKIETGYGQTSRPAAVTGDGEYLVLGSGIPWDADPRAWRREILDGSDLVLWDHPGKGAKVSIVEFSDFECPGCKRKWPVIKKALETFGGAVRHGMVNFPLTRIHPWAFRAAVAGWCVARQDPEALIGLKEQYYAMQRDMELSLVPQVAHDYLSGKGLDTAGFDACYLKPPAIDTVLRQMALGYRLNIDATPTYFVNGIRVQGPKEDWFLDLIQRVMAGENP